MREQIPVGFILSVLAAVGLYLVQPGWFSDGLVGLFLVLGALGMGVFVVYLLLMAVADRAVPAEHRVVAEWPWLYVALLAVGTGVLLWLVAETQSRTLALAIPISAVAIGIVMFGFARWSRARSRDSSAV